MLTLEHGAIYFWDNYTEVFDKSKKKKNKRVSGKREDLAQEEDGAN